MGVKFVTEEALLRAKFHPHQCNNKGIGPPKLKFVLRFDQNLQYKRPANPLAIFRGLVIPKFSAPPSRETMRQTPKSF